MTTITVDTSFLSGYQNFLAEKVAVKAAAELTAAMLRAAAR